MNRLSYDNRYPRVPTLARIIIFAISVSVAGWTNTIGANPAGAGSSGIAVVEIDAQTGKAIRVTLERSSGSPSYDATVIETLQRHKYPAHGVTHLRVPFAINAPGVFTRNDVERYLSRHGISPNALLDAPTPRYTLSALLSNAAGRGRYELIVGPNGHVTSVKTIQSTGMGRLDQAAINALRNWRFRPGTVKSVLIPMHFKQQSGFYQIILE